MKSTLNIEFDSTMEMCDFIAKLNPTINLSYPGEEVVQPNPGVVFSPTTTGGGTPVESVPLADSKPCCTDCQECTDLKMERVFEPGPDKLHMPVVPEPVSPSALDKAVERIKKQAEQPSATDEIFFSPNALAGSPEQGMEREGARVNWKPTKTLGACAQCGIPFTRLHNAVKWCDDCRSKKAIAEASKKATRSGRKSG